MTEKDLVNEGKEDRQKTMDKLSIESGKAYTYEQKEGYGGAKEAYQQKIEAQLDEWSAEIDKMKAKAAKAEADARLEYNDRIEDLRLKQQVAREKLQEFRDAGEDAWEDLKAGMKLAWDSLGEAVKSAKARFK